MLCGRSRSSYSPLPSSPYVFCPCVENPPQGEKDRSPRPLLSSASGQKIPPRGKKRPTCLSGAGTRPPGGAGGGVPTPLAPLQRAAVRSVFRSQGSCVAGATPLAPFCFLETSRKSLPEGKRADPSNRKRASGRVVVVAVLFLLPCSAAAREARELRGRGHSPRPLFVSC